MLDRTRRLLRDGAMVARLTRALPRYLHRTITLDEARARVRRRLETREQRLLYAVEQLVYPHSGSPYARLLRHAGCELGDLRALVAGEGTEGALGILADKGVYVTFDELKGRREAVRGSARFAFREADFDNPAVAAHFAVYTSGSGGTPSRVGRSLGLMAEVATSMAVALDAHGLREPRHVFWLTAPIARSLGFAKLGHPTDAWFYPLAPLPLRVRLGGHYLRAIGRTSGFRFPRPVFLDLHEPHKLAAWLARRSRPDQSLVVTCTVSSAVRVAIAAIAAGLELDRVAFHAQGEPVTASRRAHVERSGAKVVANYGTVEIMTAAYCCATPGGVDDMHLLHDRYAAIGRPRQVIEGGPEVDALLFTSLSPRSAKLFLNTESGDYGRLERRACDCGLGRLGLTTHLSEIRSFEKLTGEGMTVVRTNLLQILEEVLPTRFGGTSMDYQLVEQEGANAATRLVLRVSPSVGAVDEARIRATVLEALGRGSILDAHMTEMWRHAGTLAISREAPSATRGGKVLPVHLLPREACDRTPAGPGG